MASAHGGGSFTAAATNATLTVDGVLNEPAWNTTSYSVTFGSLGTATVKFLRTRNDLYVGVEVLDPTPGGPTTSPSFDTFFDNDHDGVKELGDDAWLSSIGGAGQDFFWSPTGTGGASHYNDSIAGSGNQTSAAGTISGSTLTFEIRHPLCTGESQDICISLLGGTLGTDFQYQRGVPPGGFVNAPGGDTTNPSANWADLTVAPAPPDTTPPSVTVTSPTAGTVVSGTINVTADASDDVGVASVEFDYFDGEGAGVGTVYHLGVDTTAPYEISFDSTQYPNTIPLDATMYAIARDAAGNQTTVGNGITVTNAPLTGATISITGNQTSLAGAASAAISGIPIEAIRGAEDDGPSSAPLAGIPLAGIPLAGIPLAGIPLAGIPLAGIGFTSTNLNQNGLGGVPLSSIPLNSTTDTWEARLNANATFRGTPVQSVTLGEVLGTSVVTSPTPVSLDDLNLASSPLAGIPLAGIALGGMPLAGIPLAGIGKTTAQTLAAWCAYINTQPGYSCTDPNSLTGQTVIGIGLQGVPLAGIPLAGIPLAGIDLTSSPLAGIPLAGIDLTSSPLAGIPLAGINFASSPLAGIPLAGISAGVVNCAGTFVCTGKTLGQAFTAGAIVDGATVGDVGYYCTTGTPTAAPCASTDKPILLKDFVLNGLPPDVTLEDLLASILSETAYDWEALPLPGFPIQDFSQDGGTINYQVAFRLAGARGGSFPAEIAVKIPAESRYVPDSAQIIGVSTGPPWLTADGKLHFPLKAVPTNVDELLTFQVKAGLTLETESATAEITPGTLPAVQAPAPASTKINQTFECPPISEGCYGAPQVGTDTLYFGYTANGNDGDFFQLTLPEGTQPGAQVTVHLSHLALDDDLVVYGPVAPPLRQPKSSTSSLQVGDIGPSLQQRTQAVIPEVLGDVPLTPPEGLGVLGVSDNRGLADEEVTFIVPEDANGSMFIQITSFDGAYSNEPWMLRVEASPAVQLPAGCKQPVALGGGITKSLPTSFTGDTLYLVNSKRYGDLFGVANEDALWSKLETLAGRPVGDPARGTLIPVDAVPGVASALTPWVADPCSPGKNNDVVRAVGAYLDTITSAYKYVVLVGDWTVLPAGLVPDNTLYANERDYASTFYGTQNTQYLSSYALGYLPTDDPYGDTSYSGQGAYIPEVAVGRLVETHQNIMDQLNQYLTLNGAIDPSTALVTGYDFLSDGASAISNGLKANVANPKELINEVWTKSDLLAAMFPTSNPPVIDSVNAHYDHHRSLPADQNAANTETNLFETNQLQPTPGRLVITIGCHSGTPVSDLLFTGGFAADWDQSYAAKGAIGYIAQSTFGLGETAGVAYSEKLHALLAERLDGSLTVGQALVYAKQEYSSMPLTGGYDVKVIDGSGLYGLPMYRVGTGALTPPPSPLPLGTDAATGLQAATFNISPTFTLVTASTGRYYTNDGNASFQNRRPIEPFTKLDVTQSGFVAHGALLTGAVSNDQANFNAAFSRAIEDSAALSPELVGDATSPTRLQSIATFSTPTGLQQRLVMSTGQFLADNVPDPLGIGSQRLYTSLSGVVLYSPASETDFRAPTFGPVQAFATTPSTIGFAVDVNDSEGLGSVKRVLALYKDGTGAWRSIDLSHAAGSERWSGGGPFTGSAAEWFIQAVDQHGNVGVISNKAHIDPVIPPAPSGGITAVVTGPLTNGWYTGNATVTISGAPDITSSLDGSAFAANSVVTVSGTGLHTVEYQGSNGAHGMTVVQIDTTAPTIVATPGVLELGQTSGFGFFACADAGSGIASCTTSGIDTSTPTLNGATRTVNITATDRVGLTATASATYRVVYAFRGFFQPVDNLPVLNSVKAGNGVPVMFSLGGNQGLNIFAAGYPKSQRIQCTAGDPVTSLEETVTAGASSLTYSAGDGKYTYVWKTEKSWAGTCRQLMLRFTDGTEHHANFTLK